MAVAFLILFIFSAFTALGEQRFPPPDFESGHKLPLTTTPAARDWLLQYLDVAMLAAGLGVASWLAIRKRSRNGMVALSFFSLLYFGFWRKGCVCSIGSLQNIALALCDRSYLLPWAVTAFFVLPLAFALFAGRSFCAGVCPHGALQDLVLVKPVKVPVWLEESLSVLPYVYLGAGVLFAATGSSFILCQYDPFVPIFRLSGTSLMVLAGIGLLMLAMFVGRPYCRFLCPYGALLKLGSMASMGRVRVTPDRCTQCRLCETSCPFGALREPESSVGQASHLPFERRRLNWLLALLPALIAAGVWLGGRISESASRVHPTVSLAEQLVRDQGAPQKVGVPSVEDLALGRARQIPKEVLSEAAAIQQRFSIGGKFFGGWAGLVIGAKLISMVKRRKRTDYEPDRGACLSCARCFEYCPSDLTRRGLLPFEVPPLGGQASPLSTATENRALSRLNAGLRTSAHGYPAWRMTAWITGVFTAVVGLAMLVNHLSAAWDERLNPPQMQEAKDKLRLNPADESVRKQIRELDLQLRQGFFRHLSQTGSGRYLLLGGAIVLVFAAGQMTALRKEFPMPKPRPDAAEQARLATTAARWSVAAGGAAVAAILFGLCLVHTTALPTRPEEVEKLLNPTGATTLSSDAASLEELKRNWPRFRGADGGGVSLFTNFPVAWDPKTGAGIGWKSPTPASGFNSPIIWENRVFFSGGDASKREVFCLDVNTGRLLWREAVTVPGAATGTTEVPESSGYSAATMATDGRRVFAMFANGELGAFTLEGRPVWSKGFGALKNSFGHASSLAVWLDRLIAQVDQGEGDEGKSRLYALEGRTGEILWQRQRQVASSWATPIVIEAAGKTQIITLAVPWVIAYAAADGTELWRLSALNGEITPSPIFAGGMLFVVSPGEKLLAIRPDGQGDVTRTHIAWTAEENVPDITSPVSNGELVFTLTTSGRLTCFESRTGQKQWEHDYNSEFYASPGLAGGRLYLFGQNGMAVVVEARRQFKEIFRTEMGDLFHASPAFAQNRFIMRGATNIWSLVP